MHKLFLAFFITSSFSCKDKTNVSRPVPSTLTIENSATFKPKQLSDTASWEFFLQHLPEKQGPVVDYKGVPISFQEKHYALINYDVGTTDLQQCADALMRLRAEYLFARKRFEEIGFHFTDKQLYRFADYCNGKRPVPKGNSVQFISSSPHPKDLKSLRRYLDIVYTYAGTISLAAELKTTTDFAIGTIVIKPGSPGHCFIITDEATTSLGQKLFKLVEGYTPAQS
ncbi:MAG: DUF4846 domain-containing protein, partial [Flavisolibacter sp.]